VVAAILVALAHSLFWAFTHPPWSLADEPEHLDYILTLKDETGSRRIPRIDQRLRPEVREAVWRSERWKAHGRPAPRSPKEWIAGGGLSYEGYQPPLYYVAMTPVAALAGADPLRAMYAIRIVGAVQVALLAVLASVLTVQWFGRCPAVVPAGAALLIASMPVVIATARVTNDGLMTLHIGLGLVAANAFLARPAAARGLALGFVIAAAVLTKSPGVLLLPIALVIVAVLWRRGEGRVWMPVLVLSPGVAAGLGWAALTYRRYGTPDGTKAFLSHVGIPFDPLPLGQFVWEQWKRSWVGSSADAGVIGWMGTGVLTVAVCVAMLGLWRGPRPALALGFTVLLVAGLLIMVRIGNLSGLTSPLGRGFLPVFPPLAALVAGAWANLLGPRAALIPGAALLGAALALRAPRLW
jgi:4-amino-4-deoxy-L-arabinose transferase-like glycosyltransferase